MSTTPRNTSLSANPTPGTMMAPGLQTKSWVDINDDDDDYLGFMPVQRIGDDHPEESPSKDSVDTQPSAHESSHVSPTVRPETQRAATKQQPTTVPAVKKANKNQGKGATVAAAGVSPKTNSATKKTGTSPVATANTEKDEAAKNAIRQEMLARNLFPSYVEVTVDGAVPYSLKSTAAMCEIDCTDALMNNSSTTTAAAGGQSPMQPGTSRKAVASSSASEGGTSPKQSPFALMMQQGPLLPAAIAATANINVADRSHLGRRRRAIRVIADTLVSHGGKSMAVHEVVQATKWNKTFRPGLGCLFSFIKNLPTFFVYSHGEIALTYEEDIASTMLRTWAETDPQAAELNSIAASQAAERSMKEGAAAASTSVSVQRERHHHHHQQQGKGNSTPNTTSAR